MVKVLPNTSFLPVPKSAPAGHTTAAAHLLWQVFPRYPCLEYKNNSGQSCPVRYTWTASFGPGLMFWQKWFNLTPQFVAYQLPRHLLHPHWYFTAYSSICQVLLGTLSELSLLDFSAQPVPGSSYGDLDPLERERLRKIILAYPGGEKNLLELSDEELDKALQLVITVGDQIVPTYTGMLLLGKQEKLREYMPTAESGFLMMNGTEVSTNETFYLPLLAATERMLDFVNARNPEQEMEMGLFRISIPEFDKRAVREAIINAFSHRDYTQLGRVLVRMDSDGLTVTNPGGFIEGVTIQNILTVEPHGRNPVLADALKRIGLAERSGRGVDRIYEGSLRYGRALPDYSETSSTSVTLFIPRGMPDKSLVYLISEQQQKTGVPVPLNALLVLNLLRQSRRMTTAEISKEAHIPEAKMRATLEYLTETGIIEAIGTGRGRAYILSAKSYKDPAKYVRQTGIDQLRFPELIMKLAKQQGFVSRKDVIELLHISPSQAYRLLRKMVEDGRLTRQGNTISARYYIKK